MKLLLLSAFLAVTLAEEEGIICSSWMKRFAADTALGENKYWECPGEGQRAVLKTCPEGMVYKPKRARCRKAKDRLLKRADGEDAGKDLDLLELESLGSSQRLGGLYNARTSQFLPGSQLWPTATINAKKVTEPQRYSNLDVYQESDFNDRAYMLNVEASLSLGFLSGLITVSGSAKYLNDRKQSSDIARVTMSYKSTTRAETIPLSTPIPNQYMAYCNENPNGPTHVVTSVLYGLRAFLRFDKQASSSETVEKIGGELAVQINSIPGFKFNGKAWIDIDGKEVKSDDSLNVMYHGDTTVSTPTSYLSAIQAFNEVQEAGLTGNAPVKYQLTPLSYLCSEDNFLLKEIGDNLVNQAIKSLVELEQTKLETRTLQNSDVVNKIRQIKRVLGTFMDELDSFETKFKTKIQQLLRDLRGGVSGTSEADLTREIQNYQSSAFFYDKAHAFLEQRKRVINTISLIMEEAAKNTAPGGGKVFTVASANSNADNNCILDSDYSYIFYLALLPTENVADTFIRDKTVVDESGQWYNDLEKVGDVGGRLKDFIKFGLASWPETPSNPPKHCFLIRLNSTVSEENSKYLDITYLYSDEGSGGDEGTGFIPPPTPPRPECSPLFNGFDLKTEGTDNKFVRKHWIEATSGETEKVAKNNAGNVNTISISGLESNTAYNLTTKFKVLEGQDRAYDDLGFSPKSEVVECVTAPTTPVRNLAVGAVTANSLSISWALPAQRTADITIKYILKVRKEGGSDAESIRVVKDYSATSHQVSGLDPATLYEILIHTESDKSASMPVKVLQATAPDSIPFPEVNAVSETSVTLIEKLSLVELPEGLTPNKLAVSYVEVNELDGHDIGDTKTMDVQLNGAKGDKQFVVSGLVGGKSYAITLALHATYGNKELISRQTERLIITTPFGGTETEKVQAQFNKIKDTTDTRISEIDSVLNQQQSKVSSLSSDLDGWMGQALSKISTVSDVVAANVTAQEDILSSMVKRSCIETGINYYAKNALAYVANVNSIYACLAACRNNDRCNGASWDRSTKYCTLSTQRRGSQPAIAYNSVSINKVCYETLTGDAAKWKSCIEEKMDYPGADIAGGQSFGFGTEWDCMGWCINTANCLSITFRPSDGHCWLKNKSYGDRKNANNGLISISLTCMQAA